MIQICIAMIIGAVLGFWACAILTSAKCAANEAFSEELGEIIMKQMNEIDDLKGKLEGRR